MKAILFDVDGTLSGHGEAILANVSEQLRSLEKKGIQLFIVSGKPAHYLAGLVRGMGLEKAKLIGENGCVIFDSSTLEETHMAKRLPAIKELEESILIQFKDKVWIQPNRVALAVFPLNQEDMSTIVKFMRESISSIENDVIMYEHVDAIDIIPEGVDKGITIKKLMKELQISKEQILAIGDSTNDLSMFEEASQVMIIGGKISFKNALNYSTIDDAFNSKAFNDFINKN